MCTCNCAHTLHIIFITHMQILFATDLHMPPVGKVTKEWSGLAQEYFTDADNFKIECTCEHHIRPMSLSLSQCSPHGSGCQDEGSSFSCHLPHCEYSSLIN